MKARKGNWVAIPLGLSKLKLNYLEFSFMKELGRDNED